MSTSFLPLRQYFNYQPKSFISELLQIALTINQLTEKLIKVKQANKQGGSILKSILDVMVVEMNKHIILKT